MGTGSCLSTAAAAEQQVGAKKRRSGLMDRVAAMSIPQEALNYDMVSMQQSLLFTDSLKDLKKLRAQLYSAAEYFEVSYATDDQTTIVVETLKDYAIKALVNTIDHLGSVTYKVNDLLDEKVEEVSGTELRVSCIQQKLRTCRVYIDHEGISQQTLMINTPRYHKWYILPVGETMHGANLTKSKYPGGGCGLDDENYRHQFRNSVRSTIRGTPTYPIRETPRSSFRKGCSQSPSPRPPQQSATFPFTSTMPRKELDKRTVSPHRFPLLRSGSVSRPTSPNKGRSVTPNTAGAGQQYAIEPRRSASMRLQSEKEVPKDIEEYPSKSKRLLKALLSRRKSKKDEMLYTYLDEY
ncbi:ABL interactor-like protein 2 [Hibiscus trionum]|uniref:ABL interactor-like protein 2 n=1 Tax=Hibiscus trionum TaxID=183268 RepID=A0A9W7LT40_HIBTR|nr:ABL interactor-like protein 2 [Hibiscus trionum]